MNRTRVSVYVLFAAFALFTGVVAAEHAMRASSGSEIVPATGECPAVRQKCPAMEKACPGTSGRVDAAMRV